MCGRYQLTLAAEDVAAMHPRAAWREGHASRHQPRNQVRPTNVAPVLTSTKSAPPVSSHSQAKDVDIVLMKWGLPSSQPNSQHPSSRTLINARRETIMQLPTFRRALARGPNARRCAIPATGFFEWYKPRGGGKMDPFLVTRKHGQTPVSNMFMAGIYDVRATDTGEEAAFVIVTTDACKEYAWLHDRQPCFLDSQEEVDDWLDTARIPSEEAVSRLLHTQPGLSCKRMLPDLSHEARNQARPKAQLNISNFFAPKTSKATPGSREKAEASPGRVDKKSNKVSPRHGIQGRTQSQHTILVRRGKIEKRRNRVTKQSPATQSEPKK